MPKRGERQLHEGLLLRRPSAKRASNSQRMRLLGTRLPSHTRELHSKSWGRPLTSHNRQYSPEVQNWTRLCLRLSLPPEVGRVLF
jgi:hypothetical protein